MFPFSGTMQSPNGSSKASTPLESPVDTPPRPNRSCETAGGDGGADDHSISPNKSANSPTSATTRTLDSAQVHLPSPIRKKIFAPRDAGAASFSERMKYRTLKDHDKDQTHHDDSRSPTNSLSSDASEPLLLSPVRHVLQQQQEHQNGKKFSPIESASHAVLNWSIPLVMMFVTLPIIVLVDVREEKVWLLLSLLAVCVGNALHWSDVR